MGLHLIINDYQNFFTYLLIIFFFKSNYLYSSIKENILISVDNKIITSYDLKIKLKP